MPIWDFIWYKPANFYAEICQFDIFHASFRFYTVLPISTVFHAEICQSADPNHIKYQIGTNWHLPNNVKHLLEVLLLNTPSTLSTYHQAPGAAHIPPLLNIPQMSESRGWSWEVKISPKFHFWHVKILTQISFFHLNWVFIQMLWRGGGGRGQMSK